MTDVFLTSRIDPPIGGVPTAITPSDTGNNIHRCRAFMVSTQGSVTCLMENGSTAVFPVCLVGIMYPGSIRRINATGTTATGIYIYV